MIANRLRLTPTQTWALLIVIVFVNKIYAVLRYGPDLALYPDLFNQILCPPHCMTFSENIPYSVVWTWINPLWLGRFWYGVFIVVIDALSVIGYWHLKRIPKQFLVAWQFLSLVFYIGIGGEYQNVTIFIWLPLVFYSAWILLIPPLVKIPIGWDWNPFTIMQNPHVECIWKCSGFNGISKTNPIVAAWEVVLNVILLYAVLVSGWLLVRSWAKSEERKRIGLVKCPKCGKYWNRISVHFGVCDK